MSTTTVIKFVDPFVYVHHIKKKKITHLAVEFVLAIKTHIIIRVI